MENVQLLVLFSFAVLIGAFFFKGLSIFGDDIAYSGFVRDAVNGDFSVTINIFSIRLLATLPVAMFVKVFGFTDFGAGAYAYFSYIGTVMMLYFIGKELYGRRAGLLSAFLFAICPVALKYGTTLEPMTPLSFFLSVAVFVLIRGMKKGNKWHFWACGVVGFIATLTSPLAYVYVLFLGAYLLCVAVRGFLTGKKENLLPALGFFLLGFITAVAILGMVNLKIANGNPFVEFSMTDYYYSGTGGPNQIYYTNPSLTYYVENYFPYGLVDKVLRPVLSLNFAALARNVQSLSAGVLSMQSISINEVGFFGYFEVLAFAYLLAKGEKRSYFVMLLAAFVLGYMEFGTMSIGKYVPIYKLMRFTIIAAIPLSLVLGMALARFTEGKGNLRIARIPVAAAIVAFLLVTSLPIDYWFYLYNHNSLEYVKLTASYLGKLPDTGILRVYGPALEPYYLDYFLGGMQAAQTASYDNGAYGGLFLPRCSDIPNRTYLVIPSADDLNRINGYDLWNINETWAFDPSICGLKLVEDIYNSSAVKGMVPKDATMSGNLFYKS